MGIAVVENHGMSQVSYEAEEIASTAVGLVEALGYIVVLEGRQLALGSDCSRPDHHSNLYRSFSQTEPRCYSHQKLKTQVYFLLPLYCSRPMHLVGTLFHLWALSGILPLVPARLDLC